VLLAGVRSPLLEGELTVGLSPHDGVQTTRHTSTILSQSLITLVLNETLVGERGVKLSGGGLRLRHSKVEFQTIDISQSIVHNISYFSQNSSSNDLRE
jgi:hypothetical protein